MSNFAYSSPGVTVSEVFGTTVAPFIASPTTLAIVGAAQGFKGASESITLNGVTPYTFAHTGINSSSVAVVDLASGANIGLGNYYVHQSSNPDGINNSGDETYTIQRITAPATAPSVAVNSGTGTLNGTYVYAVSFVNPLGETAIGPQSAQITLNGTESTNLSNIPLDAAHAPNTATGRNIYRAKVVSSVVGTFHLVANIPDNVTTTLTAETTSDSTAAAAATPPTGIVDGGQIIATYEYTDLNYYAPQPFSDFPSIVNTYGAPFDPTTGAITSELSFAAMIAFQNGASEVITVASVSAGDSDIENALQLLVGEDVSLITVVSGSSGTHSALQSHCDSMNQQGQYRIGVVGVDGTATTYTAAQIQASATAINDESIIFVSPSTFVLQNPVDPTKAYNVGGQYMAAAIAGMFAARDVQYPLTRKNVAGFQSIFDKRTPTQQIQDSQAGLLEIVQIGGSAGPLQVRHGVTTAVDSISTAEASVVRAKHEMAKQVKQALDGAVVGQVIPSDEVNMIVSSVVSSVLEQLVQQQTIQGYINVTAVLVPNNPTACTVSFSYLPSFPMNNINVSFTIDTNTGDFLTGVSA